MSSFFPSYNVANMDFNDDDLVGLVSSERSTTTKQSQSNGQSHPHNIFDISAPAYTNPPYHFSPHFNSTIPPLASYDEQNGHLAHSHTHSHLSRSRSRSRPPSIGPTRSRRGNSISSTSPPPHSRPNPSHIMIPSSRAHQASSPPPPSSALSTGGWYIPPTPDSIGNPHSLPYTHYDDASSGLPASFPNFSPVQSPTSAGGVGGSVQDKQSLLANEKRRRRRESHNAVERRRRDNINEKITELATLIPECLLEGATPNGSTTAQAASSPPAPDEIWGGLLKEDGGSPPSGSMPELVPGANNVNGGVIKANKGMILTKSVEYIRFLQQLVTAQGARNRELESELRGIRGDPPLPSYHHHSTSHSHTNHTTGFSAHGTHTMSESGSAFSGSPLGDVQEEDLDVKPDPEDDSESGGEESRRRGRRRHRGEGMDVDV